MYLKEQHRTAQSTFAMIYAGGRNKNDYAN